MTKPPTMIAVLCRRLAPAAFLLGAPAAVAATAPTPTPWVEPAISPEVKAAMDKADANMPADLIALADKGRTDGEFYAGVMLIYGRGPVAKDPKKGCAYEEKASALAVSRAPYRPFCQHTPTRCMASARLAEAFSS